MSARSDSPTEGVAAFHGRVWLLRDRKTTFSAAMWQEETAALYRARVPFSTQPQPLLELQPSGASLLIVRVHNTVGNETQSEGGKLRLALEVRTMEDVRKAQMYHTAAPSRLLELFLDSADDRDRLIAAVHAPSPSATAASLPVAPAATESSKQLLDDAFAALERAQQERDAGRVASALDGFRHAERGFRAAERLLPDKRSRQLLQQRREDLQRTIASLVSSAAPAKPAEKPQQVAPTPSVEVPTPSPPPPPPPQTGMDILARLEGLRQFAATQPPPQESTQASEANAPSNDLTRRLAALRGPSSSSSGGTSGATALDLAARLRRLRAGGDAEDPGAVELDEVATRAEQDVRSLGSVGRLVAQAQDEVALGMVDDLDDASSISSDSIASDSSSSDSDGSASDASHKARRRE